MALLLSMAVAGLVAAAHYARASKGRMGRMPDDASRSDLFNHRLMTVLCLLTSAASATALVACL